MKLPAALFLLGSAAVFAEAGLPANGMVLDLDAAKGVTLENGGKVPAWTNQVPGSAARDFVKRDEGRKVPGSGMPAFIGKVPALGGKPALDFRQQELVCLDEDHFDGLTTGDGHTWLAVIAVHEQRVGLKDVNAFFGNLRNGGHYEGLWGCLNDDNTPWWGARNGVTFGRFDANNPQLTGPRLEPGKFHVLAGRMPAGGGTVTLEFYVNGPKPVATAPFPVNPQANPSRMAVGQERDAIEHPGVESFDGMIARLVIWQRPLGDTELAEAVAKLRRDYGLE